MGARGIALALVAVALTLSSCGEGGGDTAPRADAAAPSTEAPLIPEPTAVPTTLPSDLAAGEMRVDWDADF